MNESKWSRWSCWMGASAVALVVAGGCADTNNDAVPDRPATGPEISKAVEKTGDAVENAAAKTADAGQDVAANVATTAKIEAAFAKSASLSALDIDTSTMSNTKTVTLKGTVQNAGQKTLAGKIAEQNKPAGFKVVNNLKVSGGSSPVMNPKAGKAAPAPAGKAKKS